MLAFSSSFAGSFVLDDLRAIAENPSITSLSTAMNPPPETTVSGRPIANLTLALNYAFAPVDVRDALRPPRASDGERYRARFESNVRGYHAVNLLIHVLAGLALFGVLRRTFQSAAVRHFFGKQATAAAVAIALLWLVHPLQTSSVTYIVQRAEALAGLFLLLTVYAAIRAHGGSSAGWGIASVAACALGMGSKESIACAPLLVVAWDWFFAVPRGESFGPVWRRRWPLYAALSATWLFLAYSVASYGRPASVGFGFEGWPWWRYLITQAGVILHYLRLSVFPVPLVLDYGWPAAASSPATLLNVAVIAAGVAATMAATIRRHAFGFAGLVFFLVLAPSSSVVPIVTEVAAEHRMYVPLAAVVSVVVVAGVQAVRRARVSMALAAAGIAIAACVLGAMTYSRNQDYASEERIWADTVRKRPDNPRARVNYGVALLANRKFGEAEPHLRSAVRLDENDEDAQLGLGAVLCSTGRCAEGLSHLARAVELDPDHPDAVRNLAEAQASMGNTREAAVRFRRAVELIPSEPFLLNQASWLLATAPEDDVRDGETALSFAERAVALTGRQDPVSLDSLAVAYASLGRFESAQSAAGEALKLAAARRDSAFASEVEQHLRQFEAGLPIRMAPVARTPAGGR